MKGQFAIQGVEFVGDDGEVLAEVKSKNNPRSGNVRDILINADEKIVGVRQFKDQGGCRALGFVCMHTGDGY